MVDVLVDLISASFSMWLPAGMKNTRCNTRELPNEVIDVNSFQWFSGVCPIYELSSSFLEMRRTLESGFPASDDPTHHHNKRSFWVDVKEIPSYAAKLHCRRCKSCLPVVELVVSLTDVPPRWHVTSEVGTVDLCNILWYCKIHTLWQAIESLRCLWTRCVKIHSFWDRCWCLFFMEDFQFCEQQTTKLLCCSQPRKRRMRCLRPVELDPFGLITCEWLVFRRSAILPSICAVGKWLRGQQIWGRRGKRM